MRKFIVYFLIVLSLGSVSACATIPPGPSVTVVPARGKPFELFQQEDALCRRWAEQQIGVSPQEVINNDTATGAIVGSAVGAGFGALIGSASGQAGGGALIGGAAGMLVGAAASGSDSGRMSGLEAQRRYDTAYVQCMYAKDNHILGYSRWDRRYYYRSNANLPPPPPVTRSRPNDSIPPPPPGVRPQTPPELMDN